MGCNLQDLDPVGPGDLVSLALQLDLGAQVALVVLAAHGFQIWPFSLGLLSLQTRKAVVR